MLAVRIFIVKRTVESLTPNKSPEPTAVGAVSSAFAVEWMSVFGAKMTCALPWVFVGMEWDEKTLLRPTSVKNRLYVGVSRRLSKISCEKAKWGASLESLIVFNRMATATVTKTNHARGCAWTAA